MKFVLAIGCFAVGCLFGALLMKYGFSSDDKETPITLNNTVTQEPEFDSSGINLEEENSLELKEIKQDNKKLDKKLDVLADSISVLIDSLERITDSTFQFNDTIHEKVDSLNVEGEEILIEREQLVQSLTLKVIVLESKEVSTDAVIDSLREKMNIKPQLETEYVEVEIWKSPLGYSGYKLSKKSLIIYGMLNEGVVDIFRFNDTYYLQTTSAVYKLLRSVDLKPMEISQLPKE